MRKYIVKAISCVAAGAIAFCSAGMNVEASGLNSVLPSAGIGYTLGTGSTTLAEMAEESTASTHTTEETKTETLGKLTASASASVAALAPEEENVTTDGKKTNSTGKVIEETVILSKGYTKDLAQASGSDAESEEEMFKNLVIANVNDYVNVRDLPSEEDGEIIGKLYDDSVGTFIEEVDGWYKISSGSVEGYVKAEYCVTGEDAVEMAKEVGTRIATVNTTTLKVREEASLDAAVLGLVPIEDQLIVVEELDGWVKVDIEEGYGYVSNEYVDLSTEFVKAESKAEEEARLAKERAEQEAARKAAAEAAAKAGKSSKKESSGGAYADTGVYASGGSANGQNVVNFACQFVGNPYVYGGSSLTNGTDCSGFVMSVYKEFGVNLPHSSSADRSVGATVGSLAEAQPGDIVCYSGHVGIYIGNGQIVHASTARTGIIIGSATYRNILSIRRIF